MPATLGVSTSLIYRPLRGMCEDGLLECDADSMHRGARYWLRPDLVDQAEAEARAGQPLGFLMRDQTLLMVECSRITDLAEALTDAGLSRSVVWSAELDGGDRFLLVLDQREDSTTLHARLRAAIESSGAEYKASRIARVLDASALRALLASVRDAS